MSYIHKWVNDWARYFAVDNFGNNFESSNEMVFKGDELTVLDSDNAMTATVPNRFTRDFHDSIQKRELDGFKELSVNDKPEWKAGLPPANIKCEARRADGLWYPCETIGEYQGSMVCATGWGFKNMDAEDLRSIQSERDKVIAKAMNAAIKDADCEDLSEWVHDSMDHAFGVAYDLGMLSMPDKGES